MIKCDNIIKYTKIIIFDNVIKENIKEHNPNWPWIPDHPYTILITWRSGLGKTNSLFYLINQPPDINIVYLYAKDTLGDKKLNPK